MTLWLARGYRRRLDDGYPTHLPLVPECISRLPWPLHECMPTIVRAAQKGAQPRFKTWHKWRLVQRHLEARRASIHIRWCQPRVGKQYLTKLTSSPGWWASRISDVQSGWSLGWVGLVASGLGGCSTKWSCVCVQEIRHSGSVYRSCADTSVPCPGGHGTKCVGKGSDSD